MDADPNLQTFPPSAAQGNIGGSGGSRPPPIVDGIFIYLFSV